MRTPLREIRLRMNLTQQDVAEAVGVDKSRICRIERFAIKANGTHERASPELAAALADFFDGKVTRDQIIFPEHYMNFRKRNSGSRKNTKSASRATT